MKKPIPTGCLVMSVFCVFAFCCLVLLAAATYVPTAMIAQEHGGKVVSTYDTQTDFK